MDGRHDRRIVFAAVCLSALFCAADCTLQGQSLASDLLVDAAGVLTVEGEFDLAGRTLAVSNVTAIVGSGAFTNSAGIGTLDVEAVADFQIEVGLSGALKFVKRGLGTVVLKYPQTYSGGTEVRAGILTTGKRSIDSGKSSFGWPPRIAVYEGGQVDAYGGYKGYDSHVFDLYGGSIANNRYTLSGTDDTHRFAPMVNLHADSTLAVGNGKTFNFSGTLNLGGNTLKVEVAAKSRLYWRPDEATGGTVDMSGGGTVSLLSDVDMRGATLKLALALDSGGHAMRVDGYEPLAGASSQGGCALLVHGRFVPSPGSFPPPEMQDGSSISLAAIDGVWRPQSDVLFARNATVALDVGSRHVAVGDRLVSWPDGCRATVVRRFELSGESVAGLALDWDETGVFVVNESERTVSAVWTGLGGDGDTGNPLNWRCIAADGTVVEGALPDSSVCVSIPYLALASINCPTGRSFACARVDFVGERPTAPVELRRDLDWRGLGGMAIPFSIDLKGHRLSLALAGTASAEDLSVISSEANGELHVSVPADVVCTNETVSLNGRLSFFKEGDGVFVASKAPQAYRGETVVSGGVLRCADGADISSCSPFGMLHTVCVSGQGALDPAGSHSWDGFSIELDGGSVSNTVRQIGTDNLGYNVAANNMKWPFDPVLVLLSDASFATTADFNFLGEVVSNGFSLKVNASATLRWAPKRTDDAAFEFSGGGVVKTLSNFPVLTPAATIRILDARFDAGGDVTVSNYVAASAGKVFAEYRNSMPRLSVCGTFTPAGSFFGCTMLDGSAICLAHVTGAWSTKCAQASGGKDVVDFADGATVTIDVHGRVFSCGEKIVSVEDWDASGANRAKFRIDRESRAAGNVLVVEPPSDGSGAGSIYVERSPMILLIR